MNSCLRWLLPLSVAILAAIVLQPITPATANGVGTVYVASEAGSSISVVDSTTNTVVELVPLNR
ncbi:MAG: hypothetical protein ACYC66_16425, partial [Chloroflexota bacterium]